MTLPRGGVVGQRLSDSETCADMSGCERQLLDLSSKPSANSRRQNKVGIVPAFQSGDCS
jgi:hypothetical protein